MIGSNSHRSSHETAISSRDEPGIWPPCEALEDESVTQDWESWQLTLIGWY